MRTAHGTFVKDCPHCGKPAIPMVPIDAYGADVRRDTARRIAEWMRVSADWADSDAETMNGGDDDLSREPRAIARGLRKAADAIESGEWEQSKGGNDNGK